MKITTFAHNIYLNDLEYNYKNIELTSVNRKQQLIPISEDFKKIELFNIEDNEGYFEGGISMLDNSEVLVDKRINTCDLYMLWYDLYQTIIEREYNLSYLDINFEIDTLHQDNNIILSIKNLDGKITIHTLSLNEYKSAVKKGFIEFFNHLNHDYIRNKFDSPYYFKLNHIYSEIN